MDTTTESVFDADTDNETGFDFGAMTSFFDSVADGVSAYREATTEARNRYFDNIEVGMSDDDAYDAFLAEPSVVEANRVFDELMAGLNANLEASE